MLTRIRKHIFSAGLFYTDAGSLALVLVALLMAARNRPRLSALASAGAVLFRQTNVVWAAFVVAFDVDRILHPPSTRTRGEGKAEAMRGAPLGPALVATLRLAWTHRVRLVRRHIPALAVVAAFVAFILGLNEGRIVLGDPDAHRAAPHAAMVLYAFWACCAAHLLVHWAPSRVLARARAVLASPRAALAFLAACVCAWACAKHGTIAHPYLLADNRHYAFYVWRRVLGRSAWMRNVGLAPCHVYAAWSAWDHVRRAQRAPVVLAFWLCCAAVLVPTPLLEPRYFIIPYALQAVLASGGEGRGGKGGKEGKGKGKGKEGGWSAALFTVVVWVGVIVWAEWMFLMRPFAYGGGEGGEGEGGRFMW